MAIACLMCGSIYDETGVLVPSVGFAACRESHRPGRLGEEDASLVAECLGWRRLFAAVVKQAGGTLTIEPASLDLPEGWIVTRVPPITPADSRRMTFRLIEQ